MDLTIRNRAKRSKRLNQFVKVCREEQSLSESSALHKLEELAAEEEALLTACAETREGVSFRAGMELVLVGVIGAEGSGFLAEYMTETLKKTLPGFFIHKGTALSALCPEELPEGYPLWYVGEGGMYRTLNDVAADTGTGFEIDYTAVPVDQTTIEFCEVFELDPWQLYSGNCYILAAERGSDVLRGFKNSKISCSVIGRLTPDNDKAICHRETRSLLNRPQPDELLKAAKLLLLPEEEPEA